MVTTPDIFMINVLANSTSMCSFLTLGQNQTDFFDLTFLCIILCSWLRCIIYVLCTLPMYHLSIHTHNLYTFAQSTQCLYICSYFMSHMIFLYMCMCQMLPENNEKLTCIMMIQCVSILVCYDFINLFFQFERNKCRKQLSALWHINIKTIVG